MSGSPHRGKRADRRERLSRALSGVGLMVAAATWFANRGQWADYCRHRFGTTHQGLAAAFALGLVGAIVGFRSDDDLRRLGRPIGLVAGVLAVGCAVVVWSTLVMRGCGD